MVAIPETRYAESNNGSIAYQVIGSGALDIVVVPNWFTHLEAMWDLPEIVSYFRHLSSFGRVIVYDQRGTGMSDPLGHGDVQALDGWVDDLRAVMDKVGLKQAALIATDQAAFPAVVFSGSHPDRAQSLVLINAFPRYQPISEYPPNPLVSGPLSTFLRDWWGRGAFLDLLAPSLATPASRARWARYERFLGSPATYEARMRMASEIDITEALSLVQAPTLVMHRRDSFFRVEDSRFIAERIAGARYVELPGPDHFPWAGDVDLLIGEVQAFLTGGRPRWASNRALATVLFTDLVASSRAAVDMGDRAWRRWLDSHDVVVSDIVRSNGGRLVKSTGDGVLAVFDQPGLAIRSAMQIHRAVKELGMSVRSGIHTGEIELRGDDISGVTVVTASRVADLASRDRILVTRTVKDLVAGSGHSFESEGGQRLKGVPGDWQLFSIAP